jgi:hypothetical protein
MTKKISIITLAILAIGLSSCKKDSSGSNTNPPSITGQTFSVFVDAQIWTPENENDQISSILQDLGGVKTLSIIARRTSDASSFTFPIKYFYGNDTTINFSLSTTPSTVVLFKIGTKNYNQRSGSLHIVKTTANGIETMTGDFSGTWKDVLTNTTVNTTNGQFVAKRIL